MIKKNSQITVIADDREGKNNAIEFLSDIGSKRAIRLLDAFGSVDAVVTANLEEFIEMIVNI